MGQSNLDKHGQPNEAVFHFSNNAIKAVNTLYGLCMGVLADGKVNDREVLFLDTWLKDNLAYIDSYPLNLVAERLQDILSDGVISQQEKDDLYAMLGQLIGGTMDESGAVGGQSTQLPIDSVDCIEFQDRVFCFTGKFIRGQRSVCEELVVNLGACISKNVVKKLDYLIIGELASRDWVAASHGRKIEKALFYRQHGSSVQILSEQDWVRFL
ncbi:MAG: BRCT domain-containing protein [Methylococcales bacterium]|nr:BRCT domain-containing protein [Methylococcales bacterium]